MAEDCGSLFQDIKFVFKIVILIIWAVCTGCIQFILNSIQHGTATLFMISMTGYVFIILVSIVLAIWSEPDEYTDKMFMGVGFVLNMATGVHFIVDYSGQGGGDDVFKLLIAALVIAAAILMLLITIAYEKSLDDIPDMLSEVPFVLICIAAVGQIIVTTVVFGYGTCWPRGELNLISHLVKTAVGIIMLMVPVFIARYIFEGPPDKSLELPFIGVCAVLALLAGVVLFIFAVGDNCKNTANHMNVGDLMNEASKVTGSAGGAGRPPDKTETIVGALGEIVVGVLLALSIVIKFFC